MGYRAKELLPDRISNLDLGRGVLRRDSAEKILEVVPGDAVRSDDELAVLHGNIDLEAHLDPDLLGEGLWDAKTQTPAPFFNSPEEAPGRSHTGGRAERVFGYRPLSKKGTIGS